MGAPGSVRTRCADEEDAAFARAWLCGDADPELEDDDALFAPLAPIARPGNSRARS